MLKQLLVAVLVGIVTYWWLPSEDPFNPESIKGKKVLVTGASSGIGEQLAYYYARLGADVVITARREKRLEKVIETCRELGLPRATFGYVAADMANKEDNKKVIKAALRILGGLDHLVLNHGTYDRPNLWQGTDEDIQRFEEQLQVNTVSYVRLASYAKQYLEKSGSGAIGVVNSGLGKIPSVFFAGYSASKFALDGFFSSLRHDFKMAKVNVTITSCFFGVVETDKMLEVQQDMDKRLNCDTESIKKYVSLADPKEVAWTVLRSTALGEPEMYYTGHHLQLMVHVRHLFPRFLDYMSEQMYAPV